jgi:hypothetical protein
MRTGSLLFATLSLTVAAVGQPGQVVCNGQNCTCTLNYDDAGAYLTGITGAPFSGQEQLTDSRTLPNGTHLSNQSLRNMTYRDSKGRVRTERHVYDPAPAGRPAPPNDFVVAEIHDPVAGLQYVLDPVSKVAHRMTLPQTNIYTWDPSTITNMTDASSEFLGTQKISGITAYGRKTVSTWTGPNGDTVVTTQEQWLAPATGVLLSSKTSRAGDSSVTSTMETNYSEAEPDASLFQIPAGYQTVDETGSFQVVHPQAGAPNAAITGRHGPQLTGTCEEGACSITFDPGNAPVNTATTGAPYSGHQIFSSAVNGSSFAARPKGTGVYRDSSGRLRTDPAFVNLRSRSVGSTEPSLVEIEDPVAGYFYILDAADQTAYRLKAEFRQVAFQPFPMQPAGTHTMPGGVTHTIENLPSQNISGVTTNGQRDTTTYPPGTYNGNDKPVVIVNERWIDPKTGVTIQTTNTGLRANTTNSMPDYQEGDPDPALFQIPANYKAIEETAAFTFSASANH